MILAVLLSLILTMNIFAETKAELEQKGDKELEKGVVDVGVGLGYAGLAIVSGVRGDPIGAAAGAIAATQQVRSSVEHFSEAKRCFDLSRDFEREGSTIREPEPRGGRDD